MQFRLGYPGHDQLKLNPIPIRVLKMMLFPPPPTRLCPFLNALPCDMSSMHLLPKLRL